MVIGSLVLGLILLFLMPIAVYQSFGYMESPSVDVQFDEAAFLSQLTPEQQADISAIEADGRAIADAMAARGLQEQTIKAQLIYMSYFDSNRLTDFAAYAEHFSQNDEQLIQSLNYDYSLDIDYKGRRERSVFQAFRSCPCGKGRYSRDTCGRSQEHRQYEHGTE